MSAKYKDGSIPLNIVSRQFGFITVVPDMEWPESLTGPKPLKVIKVTEFQECNQYAPVQKLRTIRRMPTPFPVMAKEVTTECFFSKYSLRATTELA